MKTKKLCYQNKIYIFPMQEKPVFMGKPKVHQLMNG